MSTPHACPCSEDPAAETVVADHTDQTDVPHLTAPDFPPDCGRRRPAWSDRSGWNLRARRMIGNSHDIDVGPPMTTKRLISADCGYVLPAFALIPAPAAQPLSPRQFSGRTLRTPFSVPDYQRKSVRRRFERQSRINFRGRFSSLRILLRTKQVIRVARAAQMSLVQKW